MVFCDYAECENKKCYGIPRFPLPKDDRREIWLLNSGNSWSPKLLSNENIYICADHFDNKFLLKGLRSILSTSAVPILKKNKCVGKENTSMLKSDFNEENIVDAICEDFSFNKSGANKAYTNILHDMQGKDTQVCEAQFPAVVGSVGCLSSRVVVTDIGKNESASCFNCVRNLCCEFKKVGGNGTDCSDSDISLSRLKQKVGQKRSHKSSKDNVLRTALPVAAKKPKSNDEVVCTLDVLSMLEPICQLTVPNNSLQAQPTASSPYHTINDYLIALNAAQQDAVHLPNEKLIEVNRQGIGPQTKPTVQNAPNKQSTSTTVNHNANTGTMVPQFQPPALRQQYQQVSLHQPNQQIETIRYQGDPTQQMINILPNGTPVTNSRDQMATLQQVPTFIKQFFADTPLGQSRTQLQNQILNAMEICQHLMGKVQSLTNCNAYKTAKRLTDVKELYIHLSYLLTYAIGRFKGLQDSSLSDMRDLGFINDANSLENGQLAAEKQASDAEEDEITIVEPKTDTINLDSDNEDDVPPPAKSIVNLQQQEVESTTNVVITKDNTNENQYKHLNQNPNTLITVVTLTNIPEEHGTYDFLAGLLGVEISKRRNTIQPPPKKTHRKTTNKHNPTLIKNKSRKKTVQDMQHRERLDHMKKTDAKLKMQVQIPLNKVEDIYEYVKTLLEELKNENVIVNKKQTY